MHRTETEFCRQQAERLSALAENCVDAGIRKKVRALAKEWADRATSKESLLNEQEPKSA